MDEDLERRLAELGAEESSSEGERLNDLEAEDPRESVRRHAGRRFRHDPTALAFGVGFVGVGLVGLAQSAGLEFASSGIYPTVLLGLGAAGLWSVLKHRAGS